MKIAEINMTHTGSTGRIMFQTAEIARNRGHEVKTCTPVLFSRVGKRMSFTAPEHFAWGTDMESAVHYYIGSIFGQNGRLSRRGTRELLKQLDQFQPDVIHLHNLHAFCINLPMLFGYIKKNNIRTIWTLHDCWSFTGHCPYFERVHCKKWKADCYDCPQHLSYPKSYVDDSKRMYRLKKQWFTGVEDMTLVTPSQWLANLVDESFLKDYPVKVIHNGIDLDFFQPIKSDFRKKYHCENKKIVLGVSFAWGSRKGLDVFKKLAVSLDECYQIVLVGTNEYIDADLPANIISIHRTDSQRELAEIYSAADVFVNPTREDNFPTVNMESLACGTPVITFRTGGSPEMIDATSGVVVEKDDIEAVEREICRICNEKPFSQEACVAHARMFDARAKFEEYIELYEDSTHSITRTL